MTNVDDMAVSAEALALMLAGRVSTSATRELLNVLRQSQTLDGSRPSVFELAGIRHGELAATLGTATRVIETGATHGVYPVPISSAAYPRSLRQITDAPPILYVRGNVDALQKMPGVSVVGTRKATPHGMLIAERIATHLGSNGFCVVSGLALGIDAAAHEGALLAAEPTIAVLAHGLQKASPRANGPLAQRILESGGAWVAEHPYGVEARRDFFVLRNRIQVGLSCASVIVEGEEKSGSMTQAEYTIRSGRALFAVLPEQGRTVTTQHQLPFILVNKRGATAIRSREDYPTLLQAAQQRRDAMLQAA